MFVLLCLTCVMRNKLPFAILRQLISVRCVCWAYVECIRVWIYHIQIHLTSSGLQMRWVIAARSACHGAKGAFKARCVTDIQIVVCKCK